jgi:CheY-like chemotaxis protein
MPQRILIADDNPTFRKALRQLLQGVDHWEIVEAAEGQEAVTKSVETRPDLVLLDLAMPVKDGFAAAREISQLLPGTPILMCTMHSSPHVETEAQKSGIRQVLSKTNSTLILPAVQQWLTPPEPPIQESSAAPVPIVVPDPTVPESVVSPTSAAEPTAELPNGLPKNVA